MSIKELVKRYKPLISFEDDESLDFWLALNSAAHEEAEVIPQANRDSKVRYFVVHKGLQEILGLKEDECQAYTFTEIRSMLMKNPGVWVEYGQVSFHIRFAPEIIKSLNLHGVSNQFPGITYFNLFGIIQRYLKPMMD